MFFSVAGLHIVFKVEKTPCLEGHLAIELLRNIFNSVDDQGIKISNESPPSIKPYRKIVFSVGRSVFYFEMGDFVYVMPRARLKKSDIRNFVAFVKNYARK